MCVCVCGWVGVRERERERERERSNGFTWHCSKEPDCACLHLIYRITRPRRTNNLYFFPTGWKLDINPHNVNEILEKIPGVSSEHK